MDDTQAYWCFTHQTIEPTTWAPHPDHLRIGPMPLVSARAWADACPSWEASVLPLNDDPEQLVEVA